MRACVRASRPGRACGNKSQGTLLVRPYFSLTLLHPQHNQEAERDNASHDASTAGTMRWRERCINRVQRCTNRVQRCTNRVQRCTNRVQRCTNRVQRCTNRVQRCINRVQRPVNPRVTTTILFSPAFPTPSPMSLNPTTCQRYRSQPRKEISRSR